MSKNQSTLVEYLAQSCEYVDGEPYLNIINEAETLAEGFADTNGCFDPSEKEFNRIKNLFQYLIEDMLDEVYALRNDWDESARDWADARDSALKQARGETL